MSSLDPAFLQNIGWAIFALFTILLATFWLIGSRRKAKRPVFRDIEALVSLPATVGQAVETGRRLHVSLGSGSIGGADSASALACLSVLDQISAAVIVSDKPPIVTTADGAAMLLAQDTLKGVYARQNALERYDPNSARVAGITPLAFNSALTSMIPDETIAGTVLVGSVGPEAVLLAEASRRAKVTLLGGSDEPAAQAAFLAAADYPLVGEDLFACGAYIGRHPAHIASLQAQDIVRILIALLIAGLGALATLERFFSF